MNSILSPRTQGRLQAIIPVVALAWLAGCQTTGYKKSDVAALNSAGAAQSVQSEIRELDGAMAALNDLVNQPADDAQPQFLAYGKALDRLEDSTRTAEKEVNLVWAKRNAYFAVWEKEIPTIQDPATRSLSQYRKAEVSNQFDAANHRFNEAQKNLQTFMVFLEDIRKALSTDLTRDGLVAIRPSVNTANNRAAQVRTSLQQSAAELDRLSSRTASYRVQDVK